MVNNPITNKSQNQLKPNSETKGFASFDKSIAINYIQENSGATTKILDSFNT